MTYISIDFETTGAVPGWPNEPWQLGLVAVTDGRPVPGSQWETFFRIPANRPFSRRSPGRWAELRDVLAEAPAFAEMWPELSERVARRPLVAHNAATERTILQKHAPLTPFGPWTDTLALARARWPKLASYTLGGVIGALGLQDEVDSLCPGRTWHDALYDACAGAVLFCRACSAAGTGLSNSR